MREVCVMLLTLSLLLNKYLLNLNCVFACVEKYLFVFIPADILLIYLLYSSSTISQTQCLNFLQSAKIAADYLKHGKESLLF